MRGSWIGSVVSAARLARRSLCVAVQCGAPGAENDLFDFIGFCANLSYKGTEYDSGRWHYQKWRDDALCDVDRYDRHMAVRRADRLSGSFCVGTADSAGIFDAFTGRNRQALDFAGSFSKKELDAAAVVPKQKSLSVRYI